MIAGWVECTKPIIKTAAIDTFCLCCWPRRRHTHGECVVGSTAARIEPTYAPRVERRAGPPGPCRPSACGSDGDNARNHRSEEHTSELQSLMRISYAVFCLKKNS